MPTIRLKFFWIIEAKPGYVDLEIGDFLQTYFYAIHPEMQVPYIVLCNGKCIDIYDINYNEKWGKPFFRIEQVDCEEKFEELVSILSAGSILQSIRERIICQIQNSFEVELDIEQFSNFKIGLNRALEDIKNNIRENEERMKINVMEEQRRKYQKYIENARPEERAKLLKELMQVYYSRTLGEFKVDCLGIYLMVVKNKLKIGGVSKGERNPQKELADIIIGNLTYHRDSEMLNNKNCDGND